MSERMMQCRVIFFGIMSLLSIITITFSSLDFHDCVYFVKLGLTVTQYLLGIGIWSLVNSTIISILIFYEYSRIVILLLTIISTIFGSIWFILGIFILFGSNIDCIRHGAGYIIYSLVLWCLTVIQIVINCFCSYYDKNVDYEEIQ